MRYEIKVIEEDTYLSIWHSEVACDGRIVYYANHVDVTNVYSSDVT